MPFFNRDGTRIKKKTTVLPPGGGSSPGGENGEGFSGENFPLLRWTLDLDMPLQNSIKNPYVCDHGPNSPDIGKVAITFQFS